jgi:hypothetical protein
MSKFLWAVAAVLAAVPNATEAQFIYQGPGAYSTYGNQTYGPAGTQSPYGNYNGTTYATYGNTTYGSDGTTSQTFGNQTYITDPNGRIHVCSTHANHTYCN